MQAKNYGQKTTKWTYVPIMISLLLVGLSLSPEQSAQAATDETQNASFDRNTFLGGSNDDYSRNLSVDESGNIYITGGSHATWGTPVNPFVADSDAFVAKLNSSGTLVWNTFLGGNDWDGGYDVAVDSNSNVYVIGTSYATWGAPLRQFAGDCDIFVTKLSNSGVIIWSTFLGGIDCDNGSGIAIGDNGKIYISGDSGASWGAPLNEHAGQHDALVAMLDSNGRLLWNTFLGGSDYEYATSIVVGGSGNIYINGQGHGPWGTPVKAYGGGEGDAFVVKLNSSGTLIWNTFLGGSGWDLGFGITLDGNEKVYAVGTTMATGTDDASWGSPVRAFTWADDAFVAKLDTNGELSWSTFLGGNGSDEALDIALDENDNIYVAGSSTHTWGTPLNALAVGVTPGFNDAFVSSLDPSGALIWNTFLGSSDFDGATGIWAKGGGAVYVSGVSFTTWGKPLNPFAGGEDVFLATVSGSDSDGDGLYDIWETLGATVDPDSLGTLPSQYIDLSAMGADKNKPDIFVQLDWKEGTDHNHKLSQLAIKRVVDAFAASPYISPTGSVGINLHVDEGPNSVLNFTTGETWGDLSRARSIPDTTSIGHMIDSTHYDWTDFQKVKDRAGGFKESGRVPVFHYAISGHLSDVTFGLFSHTGFAREEPASDFIVSLGKNDGTNPLVITQAGTFMHELGHNLALCHGGPVALAGPVAQCDVNYKPNYLSVMNYSFQKFGLIKDGQEGFLDYSSLVLPALDESHLFEPSGLPGSSGYGTRRYCSEFLGLIQVEVPVVDATDSIDWNCDNDPSNNNVSYDVNGDGIPNQVLLGYNDWPYIKIKNGAIGQAGVFLDFPVVTELKELSIEEAEKILPLVLPVPVDIKPSSCPNPIRVNTTNKDVIPVALLGTDTFDVNKIELTSIKLEGVSPLRSAFQDVATPFEPVTDKQNALDCTTAGPDGFLDLNLKFNSKAVITALGIVNDRDVRILKLTGNLKPEYGSTPIRGEDVVVIVKK